eukprot:97296_1
MGCCSSCCDHNNDEQDITDERKKLLKHNRYTKYDADGTTRPRISRALTRRNTFLLKIGLLGDVEIVEKRCWLLRLLDEDEFDIDEQTQTEYLQKHQISQCNKNIQMGAQNYCAHIVMINDDLLDIDDYNALLLCYDTTNRTSLHQLKPSLKRIKGNAFDGQQIAIMGLTPSCDVMQNEIVKQVDDAEANELCDAKDMTFAGITNAKTGQNVSTLVKRLIQKCVATQSTQPIEGQID